MSKKKQLRGGLVVLALLAGVTLLRISPVAAQSWGNQYGGGQYQTGGWNDRDDKDDRDKDRDRGCKFGIYDDRWDRFQEDMRCQVGAIMICVPLLREDGRSVFSSEVCDRLRRRSRNCIVYVKVKPVMEKECGADCVIEYRHMNPAHCPGDEKNYNAMRRLWREAKSLGIDKCIAWAPEANSRKTPWSVENCLNSPEDFCMSFQMFWKAGREEGCSTRPIWSISRWNGDCIDPRKMYPGDDCIGGFGGAVYYKPEWNKNSSGQWSAGWRDHIGEMCEELNYFNRGRKPCYIETGAQRGPWTQDCLRDMSRSSKQHRDIAAIICNNRYEEDKCGKVDDWRWSDCLSQQSFRELCESFGWRD